MRHSTRTLFSTATLQAANLRPAVKSVQTTPYKPCLDATNLHHELTTESHEQLRRFGALVTITEQDTLLSIGLKT